MVNNYSNDNGTSTIVYKIEKWSIRNTLVVKLKDALVDNPTPSPVILGVDYGVNKNGINVTVSSDITPLELDALDKLIKSLESILFDRLSENLSYMRLHS